MNMIVATRLRPRPMMSVPSVAAAPTLKRFSGELSATVALPLKKAAPLMRQPYRPRGHTTSVDPGLVSWGCEYADDHVRWRAIHAQPWCRSTAPATLRGGVSQRRGTGCSGRLPVALVALLLADASWALVVGVSVAMVSATVAATGHRLDRQARNSADASLVAALLGDQAPSLGTWSIEADFAQLVAGEIQAGRELIVECGSGATTLVVAACLKACGSGRLLTIEHDAEFAVQTRRRLDSADLSEYVDLVVAPLVEQRYGSVSTTWYDETSFAEHLPDAIDLLIVDGPPSTHAWARWPALEYFARRLATDAVVLVDDGRRRDERRSVFSLERGAH